MTGVKRSGRTRASAAVVVAALLSGGAVGCTGSDGGGKDTKGAERPQSRSMAAQALTAAYKRTSAAKSAKVEMTMSMPAGMGAGGGGEMKVSGVQGWNPTVMDLTVTGSGFAAGDPDAPEKIRMVWQDNVMYMDGGAQAAKEMDGKRWVKMDLGAMADASGNKKLAQQMTGSLDSMNQDPAQQLAILLDSPNLKHIGSQKVDGVQTQHYKGRLTVEEMMDSNGSLKVLGKKDRRKLLDNLEKTGIKGYDTEVWVNEDDYPVRMDVAMRSSSGAIRMSSRYSDYGAAVHVDTPPASETYDLSEMLKGLKGLKDPEGGTGTGSGSGADAGI